MGRILRCLENLKGNMSLVSFNWAYNPCHNRYENLKRVHVANYITERELAISTLYRVVHRIRCGSRRVCNYSQEPLKSRFLFQRGHVLVVYTPIILNDTLGSSDISFEKWCNSMSNPLFVFNCKIIHYFENVHKLLDFLWLHASLVNFWQQRIAVNHTTNVQQLLKKKPLS